MSTPEPDSDRVERLASEVAAEFRAGRLSDPNEVAKRYPDLAGDAPDIVRTVLTLEAAGSTPVEAPLDGDMTRTASESPASPSTTRTIEARPHRDPAAPPDLPGYELVSKLGHGGMGIVYRARQLALQRDVAIKMVAAGEQAEPKDLVRFLMEAEAVAAVRHPHVVQVFEFGQHDGRPFFVMEYLSGGSLAGRLRKGSAYSIEEAATLVEKLARAVQAAHELGIVHRDLKPSNVLFDAKGEPKVTDFGLAKRGTQSDLTRTGAILGTPGYMAPEQAAGQTKFVGPAADVYALGVILYECLTGAVPFTADSVYDLLFRVVNESPAAIRARAPGVPQDLELICLTCLAKAPRERYQSAGALADDLARFRAGEPISVRPARLPERALKWARRNPVVAGLAAAVAVSLVAGLLGTLAFALSAAENARAATAAKEIADTQRTEATRQLARVHAATGTNAIEAGDFATGLLWYERAWAVDRTVSDRDDAHRTRLAGVLGRMPALRGLCVHADPVFDAKWQPGGDCVLTRTTANEAYLWNPARAEFAVPPLRHAGRVRHIDFSRDGRRIVTSGDDNRAKVWDTANGAEVAALAHPAPVLWAAAAPNGQELATGCADGTLRVWALSQPSAPRLAVPIGGPVSFVAYDPAGEKLLIATDTHVAAVHAAADGKRLAGPVPHRRVELAYPGEAVEYPVEPEFSPDGKRFAALHEGLTVYDAANGKVVRSVPMPGLFGKRVGFLPDGRAFAQVNFQMLVYDPNGTGDPEEIVHPRECWGAAFPPSGKALATCSTGGKIHLWDPAKKAQSMRPILHVGEVTALRFSPDGKRLLTAGTDGTARVWELANTALVAEPIPPGDADDVMVSSRDAKTGLVKQVSRDGAMLLEGGTSRMVKLSDRATGKPLAEVPVSEPTLGLGTSADGRFIVSVGTTTADLIDARAGKSVAAVKVDGLFHVAFAPAAGKALLIEAEQFRVIDLATGATTLGPVRQRETRGADGAAARTDVAYLQNGDISPNGDRLVIPGGAYRLIRVYGSGPTPTAEPRIHDGMVHRAVFSPNGQVAASCGSDNFARVWDPATGQPLGPPLWHPSFVQDIEFDPTGRQVLTYTSHGTVRLWDPFTGELLLPPLLHPTGRIIGHVRFSRDGQRLLCMGTNEREYESVRWRLPRLSAAIEHVPPLVRLLTGREIDATGGVVMLRDEEIRRDREAYRAAFLAALP